MDYISFSFYVKYKYIYSKKVARNFWAHFFGRPYRSNGINIHLDAGLIVVVVPRKLNVTCSIHTRSGRKIKSTHAGIQPFFSKNLKQINNGVIISQRLIWLVSSLVGFKKKKVMERKTFYDEIYEYITWSVQKFEDDDISDQ